MCKFACCWSYQSLVPNDDSIAKGAIEKNVISRRFPMLVPQCIDYQRDGDDQVSHNA